MLGTFKLSTMPRIGFFVFKATLDTLIRQFLVESDEVSFIGTQEWWSCKHADYKPSENNQQRK